MSQLFPHAADIKRAVAVGTNGRKEKQTLYTGVVCLFTPMASRTEIENSFAVGYGYDVYFKGTSQDIIAGDQMIYDGGTFNVRAVRTYAGVGNVSHKHALVQREGL